MSVRVVVLPTDHRRAHADPGPVPDALVVVLRQVADLYAGHWLRSLRRGHLESPAQWAARSASRSMGLAAVLDQARAGLSVDRVCLVLGPDPQHRVAEVEHRLGLAPGALVLPGTGVAPGRPSAGLVDALLAEVGALEVDRREAAVMLADALTEVDLAEVAAEVAAGLPDEVRARAESEAAAVERSGVGLVGDLERLRLASARRPAVPAGRADAADLVPVATGVELAASLLAVLDREARHAEEGAARLRRARRRWARAQGPERAVPRPAAADTSGRRLVVEIGRRARLRLAHALPGTGRGEDR